MIRDHRARTAELEFKTRLGNRQSYEGRNYDKRTGKGKVSSAKTAENPVGKENPYDGIIIKEDERHEEDVCETKRYGD